MFKLLNQEILESYYASGMTGSFNKLKDKAFDFAK